VFGERVDPISVAVIAGGLGSVALFGVVHVARRRAREKRTTKTLEVIGEKLPRSLHPVIDPDICIGSLSCLKACPEGDILGVVDGAARLIHGDHCIGHGRCAAECPVSAIKLVFGTSERGVDLPEVDGYFESSRPGVHVVGELGGMGLIKNAIRQGLEVADRIADVLGKKPGPVIIVGAGPAGVAAALGLKARGVPHRVLEQGKVGGSMLHYPREKVVMTEAVKLPIWGSFGRKVIPKEELLADFHDIIAKTGISVQEGVRVIGIEGEDGRFVVKTEAGDFPAAKVVLAAGRRGTPRKLGVPGEESPWVHYGLSEPEQFKGKDVLVVGGGDAAVEAALQLAGEGAKVSLSYRGEELARVREQNRSAVSAAGKKGDLDLLLPSVVKEIAEGLVKVDHAGKARELANDNIVVNIGGELPLEFLQRCGVSLRKYHGEELGAGKDVDARSWRERKESSRERSERLVRRARRVALLLLGIGVVAGLAWQGRDYYFSACRLYAGDRFVPWACVSSLADRKADRAVHALLRSSGPVGHGIGIAATLFMLSNFLYAARKRWKSLDGLGGIRTWLDGHVFVGAMSPLVIAFHAAFQAKNLLALGTTIALCVVFATGVVGRFIYSLVPSEGGKALELADLLGKQERLHGDEGRLAVARLRLQIRFYGTFKKVLRGWRTFHATLAVFLVVAMALHIGVSLYLGYGIIR
jgi:thioredoxin reductase/Pyruvate/2-oxoacid:ferredoxin oxidoreductase delta subunit